MRTLTVLSLLLPLIAQAGTQYNNQDARRLEAVKSYVNNVLTEARSHSNRSPLLADGVNTITRKPVEWIYPDKHRVTISNFASQQNFMRTLNGLSLVTGDDKYHQAAEKTARYFLENYSHENGLFFWGGHRFINLDSLELEGPQNKNQVHELKNHFPYYSFLHQVDAKATEKYIKAFWNAHLDNWKRMDMGRHGRYSKSYNDKVFQRKLSDDIVEPSKLPELPLSKGLSFINAGSDLIYAAYKLTELAEPKIAEGANHWAKFLLKQYELASNPKTGAPVYQFTSPRQRESSPPSDNDTNSKYGDRAQRQFGPEYGAIAKEGNVLFRGNANSIAISSALVKLYIAEKHQDSEILSWAVKDLKGFYRVAYDAERGQFKAVFNDGTDITGIPLVRDGYYGKKGRIFQAQVIDSEKYLFPLLKAYRLSGDQALWALARNMTKHLGWGDIGEPKTKPSQLNLNLNNQDPSGIFSALEMYKISSDQQYLELARAIGNNILKHRFIRGYFLNHHALLNARIDALEPLALVALDATLKGQPQQIPEFISEGGYIHGEYLGKSSTYDKREIYNKKI
ncbi:hypothetical protein ACRRS0_22365 [Agarivorans sp. QJM3NY_29]|uniref:hypothetical protein n=1 Tax=unclassified Agarivorans TaxID=2636026 RepID=UPI003D7ED250